MNCTDIGTIQAFLDGELGHERSAVLSRHLAACTSCAQMLADAENESALVFSVLEREMDAMVPTQRLWSKINDSIEIEKKNRSWWEKLRGSLTGIAMAPAFAAAAAVFLFVVIAGAFWLRSVTPVDVASPRVASTKAPISRPADRVVSNPDVPPSTLSAVTDRNTTVSPGRVAAVRADFRSTQSERQPTNPRSAAVAASAGNVSPDPADYQTEQGYLSTIANLDRVVRDQKENSMTVSERIDLERNLALVESSIDKMRQQVRRDPHDSSARQILYSSYQNKIDLLNSVSQKQDLVASLK